MINTGLSLGLKSDINGMFMECSSGWWYTYPSEKYEFVSWDDDIPNWMGKKMFQTTNQFIVCVCLYFYVFVYAFMKLSIATLNKKNRFGKILLQLARYLLPVLVGGIVGTIQGCNINPTA